MATIKHSFVTTNKIITQRELTLRLNNIIL